MRNMEKKLSALLLLFSLALPTCAVELSPFVGTAWSNDLRDAAKQDDISLDSAKNVGLAINWQASRDGQGQILFNFVNHDFETNKNNEALSLDIIYAHFSGVAHFKLEKYVTTFAVGIGGALLDSEENSELRPSLTAALGTRYSMSPKLSFVTEIRGYVTWINDDDDLYCSKGQCHAYIDEALWLDAIISAGIAYKF